MSPEYRVYVPEESEQYLSSFLKHIKGSSIEQIKPVTKPHKEKKVRDPKANDLLAEKVKEQLKMLPKETRVDSLQYTPNDVPRYDDLPEEWVAFRTGLQPGDKIVLIAPNGTSIINENNFNSSVIRKVGNGWPTTVNAENNWWGDLDPSDNIQGDVDFTPFATSSFAEN